VKNPALGTFAEYVVVERDEVILAPDHLDDIHLAAWPLGGLTAWR
jgi:NADPH:quinone reductase-like Zn-dependent oxidoreductase